MEELKANKELVQKEFLRGNSEVRKVLSDIFGKDILQQSITEEKCDISPVPQKDHHK